MLQIKYLKVEIKTMYSIFCNSKGFIYYEAVPNCQTVNGYCETATTSAFSGFLCVTYLKENKWMLRMKNTEYNKEDMLKNITQLKYLC